MLDADPASNTRLSMADNTDADSFGLGVRAGVVSGPRLLGGEATTAPVDFKYVKQGQVVIVGGLGGTVDPYYILGITRAVHPMVLVKDVLAPQPPSFSLCVCFTLHLLHLHSISRN
jgi:hypothetical protein